MTAKKRKTKGATRRREPLPLGKWLATAVKMSFFVAVSGLVFWLATIVARVEWQPLALKDITITDTLVYQDITQVDAVLSKYEGRSLMTLDLQQLKAEVERLDWIVNVRVEKRWPGELVVAIEEHQPVAFWNEGKVLNSEGIALAKPVAQMDLPMLHGPEGKATDVMQQYLQFNQVFGQQNFRLQKVTMHPRGAWTLEMENKMVVSLGESHVIERSRRVIKVLASPVYSELKIDYVDARYPNGVAIRLHDGNDFEGINDIAA